MNSSDYKRFVDDLKRSLKTEDADGECRQKCGYQPCTWYAYDIRAQVERSNYTRLLPAKLYRQGHLYMV
jgi:hypothetical protein